MTRLHDRLHALLAKARTVASLLCVPIVGGVIFTFQPAWCAESLKIKIGYQGIPEKFLAMNLHRRDIAPHAGIDYEVELTRFASSSVEVTALATEDINLATLGYSSFGIAVENARMNDLRLIADQYRDGVDGYYSYDFMVLRGGPIHQIADLRGAVVASNGAGSVTDIATRYILKRYGLEDRRDFTMIEVGIPNMLPMLLEGKAQLVSLGANDSVNPKVQASAKTLFTVHDALGVTEFAFFCARITFLDSNRERLAWFFEDMVRSTRWMRDPAHRDEAIKFAADFSKQPLDILSSYFLLPAKDFYRDPDSRPDVSALQRNLEAMRQVGFLKSRIDVAKYVDLSLLEGAIRDLGEVQVVK
jgi:NitT/TauT family transport system substrate-binding protein